MCQKVLHLVILKNIIKPQSRHFRVIIIISETVLWSFWYLSTPCVLSGERVSWTVSLSHTP